MVFFINNNDMQSFYREIYSDIKKSLTILQAKYHISIIKKMITVIILRCITKLC